MVYPHFTDKETKAHGRDLPVVAGMSLGSSSSPTTSPFSLTPCWPRPDASWANRPRCLQPTLSPQNNIICLWLS